ncbi:MAG: amino acid adenylation domain-containing protein, partial [Thermoanaerobaculia bacterium]
MRALATVLVGDAALTVRCGQMVQAAGHTVIGVVSGDGRVATWAAESGIACCFHPPHLALTSAEVSRLVSSAPIDLLLSIHNLRRFSPDLLALARRGAINYHDGPLPRYAGLHATTWAIDRGEERHGIAWHAMTAGIDEGDILITRDLDIAAEETAWTLNVRCIEAGLDAFGELLAGLHRRAPVHRRQDATLRTFFPGWRHPSIGCVVPWNESAERISRFVRSLDFGVAENPLGLPKLLGPSGALGVPRILVLDSPSLAPAGTVLRTGPDGVDVATTTFDVRLPTLLSLEDPPLAPLAALARIGVRVSDRLAATAPASVELARRERVLHREEHEWGAALAQLAALAPPELVANGEEDRSTVTSLAFELPALESPAPEGPGPDSAVGAAQHAAAAILLWLGEEIGQPFDVAFGEPELRSEIASHGWGALLESRPPLRVNAAGDGEFELFETRLQAELARRRTGSTYFSDLPLRIRQRRLPAGAAISPAVAVDLLGALERPPVLRPDGPIRLAIAISSDGRTVSLSARAAAGNNPLGPLALRLQDRLQDLLTRTPWAPPREGSRASPSPEGLAGLAATVAGRFLAQARKTPDAPALEAGGARWSYERLARRVERLAAALAHRGVRAETLVAIRLAHLVDLVTAMLAVHQAGGAFLILDPLDTADRVRRILAEAQPLLAVGRSGDAFLHRVAPHLPVHPVGLGDAAEVSLVDLGTRVVDDRIASTLAYVAMTSGSTGEPKGVAVEQGSLAHYIDAAIDKFALSGADRVLQLGSPAFDLALEQIFATLGCGATLVGLDRPELPPPRELLAACRSLAVTVLDLPTAVWEQASAEIAERGLTLPASLRLLVLGGEAASARAARVWLEASGGKRLLNTYGPTEATIVATWWEAPRCATEFGDRILLPIGRPVEGVRAHILDAERLPVAAGEAGELWLGGSGLARGYHRRPDLTAASFARVATAGKNHPGNPVERLYATGDRVRRGADGELEFLGRRDRQLKIGGRRVEPAEVETALRTIPGVMSAAVAARRRADLSSPSTRLQGWVALAEGTTLATVAAEAGRRLPPYLRLASLIAIDALPLTRTGKVDFDQLLGEPSAPIASFESSPAAESASPDARDEIERRLLGIWMRILGREPGAPIARQSDFFALGGDSLAAVELLVEIEAAFGVPLPIRHLLQAPTIAGLASELRNRVPLTTRPKRTASSLVSLLATDVPASPVIFCVHGLGGHLLRLLPLARALAPTRHLIGLQSPGLDDERPIPSNIEALARGFLEEIREAAFSSPYR